MVLIRTRGLNHVAGQPLDQGVEGLELVLGHLEELLGLRLVLVAQHPGLLDLREFLARLPGQLLERLLDVVLGHPLLLAVVQLHSIDPEPVRLHLLVSLLGGVAVVTKVGD